MANLRALHLTGESIVKFLQQTYNSTEMSKTFTIKFVLFGTSDFPDKNPSDTTIALTLYRTGWNEHLRAHAPSRHRKGGPLALDLYYLLSVWSAKAEDELNAFAWTLIQLHQTPILDTAILTGDAGWAPTDTIELVPQDLTHDDIARIWDKLSRPSATFRLSAAYIARVLRLEPHRNYQEFKPVVATRYIHGEKEQPQ